MITTIGILLIIVGLLTLIIKPIFKNAKLVSAGLTPQERAEWNFKTAVGVAGELKMLQLPSTYIEGNTKLGSGGNLLESLIGAELAKNMLKTPGAK